MNLPAQELELDTLVYCFYIQFISTLSLIQYFNLKGCSWRPIPAHPWWAGWHKDGIGEFSSSRAFNWYVELYIRLFDQDLGTHLKLVCSFMDSLHATTSCSPGSPLQCIFKIKEPLYHSRSIFLSISYVTNIKKTIFYRTIYCFSNFFIISRFILPLSKRPPPLPVVGYTFVPLFRHKGVFSVLPKHF